MIQHGAPEYFEVYKIWEKSAKKKREKNKGKKGSLWVSPWF